MILYCTVKQVGSRKSFLANRPFEFATPPATTRAFLVELVRSQVTAYNNAEIEKPLHVFLSEAELQTTAEQAGKVGFGTRYNAKQADEAKAIETAILAFEDGLFRVFKGEDELADLDAPLAVAEGDSFTLVRLVMLAGY